MSMRVNRREMLARLGYVALGAAGAWALPRALERLASAEADPATGAEEKLKALKLELPPVTRGTNPLLPAVRVGDMLYVSGTTPFKADGVIQSGKLGKELDVAQGAAVARNIGLRILGVVRAELGSLDKVVRLVKVLGMVNSAPEFTDQPRVINGFSELMIEVFGEQAGKGARSAVGLASLPGGVPVEIEAIFQVRA